MGTRIEHLAFNVADPVAMADWYIKNLGFIAVHRFGPPAYGQFLADAERRSMLELYHKAEVPLPEFGNIHEMALHLALAVDDVDELHSTLVNAGATPVSGPETIPSGDRMAIVRDPWGIAVQLCCRTDSMP